MQAQPITLALTDRSAGYEVAPERVRLGLLASFAADVEQFLRGDSREVDPGQLDVAIRKGSLAIETSPLHAPGLFADLQALLANEVLDGVDKRRREVMERWQKATHANRQRAYLISAPFLARPVAVHADTDYRADDADQWVQVERYVRGEIQDLGGRTTVNAHVRLPDGKTLTVSTTKELLRSDKVNRLYKMAMLRVRAQYNVLTRELRDAQLLEFVEYNPSLDDEEMAKLTRRGAQAWKDVPDATSWVEALRGGNSE